MGYVQGTTVGTVVNANFPSLGTFAFTAPNTKGNCLVVDIIWRSAPASTGGMYLTDNAGNTWAQLWTIQNGTTGQWTECWVALDIAAYSSGGNGTTVIMTYVPSSGAAYFADACIAAHEYSGVLTASAVDVYQAQWGVGGFTSIATSNITTTNSNDLIHGFGAYAGAAAVNLEFGSALLPWNLRLTAGGTPDSHGTNCADNLASWDLPQSVAQAQSLTVGTPGTSHTVFSGIISLKLASPPTPAAFPGAWLILDEPATLNPTSPGYTDRSAMLHLGKGGGSKHTFTNTLSQRGTGTIPLIIKPGVAYDATQLEGCQVFLQDVNPSGTFRVFAGTVQKVTMQWIGRLGCFIATLSVVSFRQLFDTLRVPPQTLQYMAAGDIFTYLFNTVAAGVPLTLGTINATFVINTLTLNWDVLSSVFDQIAQAANCIWDIDLATMTVYLQPPSTTASPYVITSQQVSFGTSTFNLDRKDYRNRQIIRISNQAFGQSQELFPLSVPSVGLSANFTLARPVSSLVAAWITHNTQNHATGTFTANPATNDTVSIGYPQSGSIYNWVPNAPYGVGQVIVDPANHIQTVKAQGTSGGTPPSWNDTGGTTNDGPGSPEQPDFAATVVWQDLGLSGAGGIGASVYTFVTSLDNTQWGQILIGATASQTCQNLVDAINCNAAVQGQTFSWPTWECPLVNATPNGSSIGILNKTPGSGYSSSLIASSSAFSWSGGQTSGGSTSGGTIPLSVAQAGSSNTANVSYTPGSNVLGVFINGSATFTGSAYITFAYLREGNDVIVVENTAQVLLRSALEGGTGQYMQLYTDTSITSNTEALQYVQAILAAYDSIPISFSFDTWPPGLLPGQLLTITLATPAPANLIALINGTYFVQEISAELIPLTSGMPYVNQTAVPGGGHYVYTVTVINESQVLSFLAFWEGLASGGGGSSQIGAIGSSLPQSPSGTAAGPVSIAGTAITLSTASQGF